MEPTQFVAVVSIDAANENIGHLGNTSVDYVFEHGCDLDVAVFPGGITRKSIKRTESDLFKPYCYFSVWTGKYWTWKEGKKLEDWGAGVEKFHTGETGRDRAYLSCVLEIVRCKGLVQLFPTL